MRVVNLLKAEYLKLCPGTTIRDGVADNVFIIDPDTQVWITGVIWDDFGPWTIHISRVIYNKYGLLEAIMQQAGDLRLDDKESIKDIIDRIKMCREFVNED
jgi:hypothetical protein